MCQNLTIDSERTGSLMTNFADRRRMMVDNQVRPSDVTKYPIIEALLSVERENFVPQALREAAYLGENLAFSKDRVLLEPRTLAKMLDALDITADELVLDLGAGMGYSSAVIAQMAQAVIAVEEDETLARDAETLLAETGAPRVGGMVIGTVKGDIHDIGKNLVAMMMEGAGFEVEDIGINNPVENYLAALEEHKPEILGMSALLTTTMPYMKVVIDTMVEQGIRDDYIVLVGGAPLNEEFGKAIGADAYCRDAAVAVETAKEWVLRKHNKASAG